MNQDYISVTGGAHIKPSARKSIHSYRNRCNNSGHIDEMVRYGLDTVHDNNGTTSWNSHQEQGRDEVDNVMSKIQRPASPVPVRCNSRMYRRSSFDMNNDYSEDDDDDDSAEDKMLSKSSPPAFSHYSNELFASLNSMEHQQSELNNRSNASSRSLHNLSEHQRINNSLNKSLTENIKKEGESSSCTHSLVQILIVLLVPCAAYIIFINYNLSPPLEIINVYDKIHFYNDVMNLGEKYKVKDTSILQVRSGVATIFEKGDTGSFIFAYNSESNNFNSVMFNRFVEDLAVTASRYLRNESVNHNAVVVDTMRLIMETEKEFMNAYEEGVAQTGVMLVKDVDNVPPQLAMAFHYYCDEYSPLVRRSAIFFTLNLSKCSNNSDPKSTHEYIEKCLAKKWRTVGEDRIGPLLTRVVNIVVDVTRVI